jgi:hypothetical protein
MSAPEANVQPRGALMGVPQRGTPPGEGSVPEDDK